MDQFLDGLREALDLIVSGDPLVRDIALRTLRVGFEATLIATLLGVPLGTLLALRPFRGRGAAVAFVNGRCAYLERDGHWPDVTRPDDTSDVEVVRLRDLRGLLPMLGAD